MKSVDSMIRIDKRNPEKIYAVASWAVNDHFWQPNFFKPNPAQFLRKHFDQFDGKMKQKPTAKTREFLPSSDQNRALESIEEAYSRGIR